MTVRKNFTLPDDLAEYLEQKAKDEGKKQSQIIQEMIREDLRKKEIEKSKKLLDSISGILTGKLPKDITIQDIKAQMYEEV